MFFTRIFRVTLDVVENDALSVSGMIDTGRKMAVFLLVGVGAVRSHGGRVPTKEWNYKNSLLAGRCPRGNQKPFPWVFPQKKPLFKIMTKNLRNWNISGAMYLKVSMTKATPAEANQTL